MQIRLLDQGRLYEQRAQSTSGVPEVENDVDPELLENQCSLGLRRLVGVSFSSRRIPLLLLSLVVAAASVCACAARQRVAGEAGVWHEGRDRSLCVDDEGREVLPAATHPGIYIIIRVDDGPFDNDGDGVLDDMIPRSVLADPTVDGVVLKRSLSVFYRNHARVPRSSEDYDFSQLEKALAEVSAYDKVLRFMWIPDIALREGGPTGKPAFLFDEAATGIPIVSGDGSGGCDGHLVDSETPTCFTEGRPITGDLPAYPLPLTWHGNYQGFMKDFITELSSFVGRDPNGERFVSMATSATNSKTAEVGGLPGRKRSDERVWMDYLSDHLWPSIRDLNCDGLVDHMDIKVRVKEELLGAYKEMLSHQAREFRRAGATNVRFSIATHGRSFHLRHETLNKEFVEELESYIMSDCQLAAVAMYSGNGLRWRHDPEKAPRFKKYAAEGVPTRWQTRNERRIYEAGGRTCDKRGYPEPAPDRLVASLYGGTWRSTAECKRTLFNGAIDTYFDGAGATLGAASAVEIYLEQFEDPDLRSGVGGDLIQRFHSEFVARGLVRARPLGASGDGF